ncbi:MAG: acyl dehydratase [Candidatus Rokubacteria bacterium]|nr:acyl dehydratase [Candidatus Rokubacteria bacterium]
MSAPDRLCFEEVEVGAEYLSPGRTVTEADIVLFAGLSGDYNVLHTDAEHMKGSVFGERIAHGLLGLSIQSGLLSRMLPPGGSPPHIGLKWRFRGPIRIGDTIRLRARVIDKAPGDAPECGVVTIARQVLNQRDEIVQEGETQHLVKRRPS